ncbi:hypothetical protein TcasGA2_TC013300 [Tribolium castaneum]|uniref:Uncharacterized protein n=1 Tax=Tribolium castaneum TaxID=7070 RepID=D6WP69_TRICA|nr:hypothetical protein TcasGA2_TC013300 [Tribolium castaneum]
MNEAVAWLPVTSERNLLHLGRLNVGGAPVWRLPNYNPFQNDVATNEPARDVCDRKHNLSVNTELEY